MVFIYEIPEMPRDITIIACQSGCFSFLFRSILFCFCEPKLERHSGIQFVKSILRGIRLMAFRIKNIM